MSNVVRIFNPRGSRPAPRPTPRGPLGGSGVYRPSFAQGHEASQLVRDRLLALDIAKPARGGKVLLNNGPTRSRTGRQATSDLLGVDFGAARRNSGTAVAPRKPTTKKSTAKKPAAKKSTTKKKPAKKAAAKKPAAKKPTAKAPKGISAACAKKGIKIPEKVARDLLREGQTKKGKPLSKAQRGLMGLVAGGCKTPKGKAARERAKKLDAERKKKATKKAARKPAKKGAKKPAKKTAAKKPTGRKTAAKSGRKTGKKTPKLLTASLKGASVEVSEKSKGRSTKTEIAPVSKARPKGGKAKAASAEANKAKAKKAGPKSGSRRSQVAKKGKGRGKKNAAKKAKKHVAKKHNGKKKHGKKSKAKAKKNNGKRAKKGAKASKKRSKKGKKHNRKGARRNGQLLGGDEPKLAAALGVAPGAVPGRLKGMVAKAVSELEKSRKDKALTARLEAVLKRFEKAGEWVRPKNEAPKASADEIIANVIADVVAGKKTAIAKVAKATGLSAKQVAAAAKETAKAKGGKKPSKSKKSNPKKGAKKGSKAKKNAKKPKKAAKGSKKGSKKGKKNAKKAAKGSKKGSKKGKKNAKKSGKKTGKAKPKQLVDALAGRELDLVLKGLAKVKGKKSGKKSSKARAKKSNFGFTPAGIFERAKGLAEEKVVEPVKWAAVRLPGAAAGAAFGYLIPNLLMKNFVKQGIWQKAVGAAVGGLVGIVGTGVVAGLVRDEDEAYRQGGAAAIGALGALISSVLTKSTAVDNKLRVLVGTDPDSLSDYLSDDAAPKQVQEEPKGLPMASEGADEWSSALDYGDARFDPMGMTADEFTHSNEVLEAPMADFAAPSLEDFAAPEMSDFAETALADDLVAAGAVDEMADFAAPGMGDFAGGLTITDEGSI